MKWSTKHIRMDNGPELTAHALVDWCRCSGVDPAYIDPASPWQNGVCQSFNGRFRDEFLVCEQFDTLLEVQVLAEDWRTEYNTYSPHGSLDGLTSEAFRQRWITNRQPTLSKPVDRKPGPSHLPARPSLGRRIRTSVASINARGWWPSYATTWARVRSRTPSCTLQPRSASSGRTSARCV